MLAFVHVDFLPTQGYRSYLQAFESLSSYLRVFQLAQACNHLSVQAQLAFEVSSKFYKQLFKKDFLSLKLKPPHSFVECSSLYSKLPIKTPNQSSRNVM